MTKMVPPGVVIYGQTIVEHDEDDTCPSCGLDLDPVEELEDGTKVCGPCADGDIDRHQLLLQGAIEQMNVVVQAEQYILLVGPVHLAIAFLKANEPDKALKALESGLRLSDAHRG